MAVWSEVAWKVDFLENSCLGRMVGRCEQVQGRAWGRESRFWGFEIGDRHEIARSI